MPTTLSDVAQRAGVSEATASRVLNGRRYVAATTRARVQDAARDLAYVPNRAARDLSMARTATVALLVHHAQYPAHGEGTFSSRAIDGASRALHEAGYDMLYVPVDDARIENLAALAAVSSGRSDGVIVLGPTFPRAAMAALVALGRPLVTLDSRLRDVDAVMADNRPAMVQLTRHLVEVHGARRIACLAGPARWPSTAERVAGVRSEAGRQGAEVRVLHARETTMRDGSALAARLTPDLPDAIVAVNDAMAIGAIHRLRSSEIRRGPAITGFDDIAWAQLLDPSLTTVAVDATGMGAAAARLLLDRISTPSTPPAREVRVPATLRIRASCGCHQAIRPRPDVGGGQAQRVG